jgi:hypothetical protein
VLERALAAAQAAFEDKYGSPAPDLAGCSGGPGGKVNLLNCGLSGAMERVILLRSVCAQHGISCAGPATTGNALGPVLGIVAGSIMVPRGGMIGGGGLPGLQAAKAEVTWVDETATMSERAADYQAGALGARSNLLTRRVQAPELNGVRFDGFDEANAELIDRKLSVTTFPKSKYQAVRQSDALEGSGYTGVWEVPNASEAARAQRMFDQLGITNISTRIVP